MLPPTPAPRAKGTLHSNQLFRIVQHHRFAAAPSTAGGRGGVGVGGSLLPAQCREPSGVVPLDDLFVEPELVSQGPGLTLQAQISYRRPRTVLQDSYCGCGGRLGRGPSVVVPLVDLFVDPELRAPTPDREEGQVRRRKGVARMGGSGRVGGFVSAQQLVGEDGRGGAGQGWVSVAGRRQTPERHKTTCWEARRGFRTFDNPRSAPHRCAEGVSALEASGLTATINVRTQEAVEVLAVCGRVC